MAHYKRGKCRFHGKGHRSDKTWFMSTEPRWHNILFHRRPFRRADKRLAKKVLAGIDPDNLAWPRFHRPQIYYW